MTRRHLTALALAAAASAAALAGTPPALTAAELVERNAAARGGPEAWRKIETIAWAGRVESANRGGMRAPFLLEQKRPGRTRFEVTVDGQKTVRVFDGTEGWKLRTSAASPPDLQPYSADEVRFALGAPSIEGPLMDHAAKGATITLAGLQEVDGRAAYALELRLASGSSCRVWLDAETFLELRYDREVAGAQGRSSVTSLHFADYRAVEGLRLPFAIETGTVEGRSRDRLVIERVALNPPLDDRSFGRPEPAVARHRGVTVDTRGAARAGQARPDP